MRTCRHWVILLATAALGACQQPDPSPNNAAAQNQPVRASDVAGMLAKAGLPVTGLTTVTAETDPDHLLGKPGQYTSKVLFSDRRHPGGAKNTIEVFANVADTMHRAEALTSGAKDPAAVSRYQAVSGKMYLRLDEELPPAQADQYRQAFAGLGGW